MSSYNSFSQTFIFKNDFENCKNCIFCDKSKKKKKICFSVMINRALFSKFSSSQNYFYTKEINEILSSSRNASVILFKDLQIVDDEEEFLKRFYKRNEYEGKIMMLTEYYKYHIDISRLFMIPITNIINKYHDKKRRIDYIKITRMLQENNGRNNEKETKNTENRHVENKILEGEISELSTIKKKINLSNTIQELNYKLGEIITNSKHIDTKYFDYSDIEINNHDCLDNFLTYLNENSFTPTNNNNSKNILNTENIIHNNLIKRAKDLNFQKKAYSKINRNNENFEKNEGKSLGKTEKESKVNSKKEKINNENFMKKKDNSKDFKDNLKQNNSKNYKNNENFYKILKSYNKINLKTNFEKSNENIKKKSENTKTKIENLDKNSKSNNTHRYKINENLRKSNENFLKNHNNNNNISNKIKNEGKLTSAYEEILFKLSPKLNLKEVSLEKNKDFMEKVKEISKERKNERKDHNIIVNELIKEKHQEKKQKKEEKKITKTSREESNRSDKNKIDEELDKLMKKKDNNFKNLEGLMKLDIALKECNIPEKVKTKKYLPNNSSNISKNSTSRQEKIKNNKTDRISEKKKINKSNTSRNKNTHSQNYADYKNIEQFLLSTKRDQNSHNRFFSSFNWNQKKDEIKKPLLSMKTKNKTNYSKKTFGNSKALQNFEFVSTNSELRKSFNNFNKKSEIKTENRTVHKYTKSETKINFPNQKKFLEEEIEKENKENIKKDNFITMRENSKMFLTDNNINKKINDTKSYLKDNAVQNSKALNKNQIYTYNQNNFINLFLNGKEKNKVFAENNGNTDKNNKSGQNEKETKKKKGIFKF